MRTAFTAAALLFLFGITVAVLAMHATPVSATVAASAAGVDRDAAAKASSGTAGDDAGGDAGDDNDGDYEDAEDDEEDEDDEDDEDDDDDDEEEEEEARGRGGARATSAGRRGGRPGSSGFHEEPGEEEEERRLPAYEVPSSDKAHFLETFQDREGWRKRWVRTTSAQFTGRWAVGEGAMEAGIPGDVGLLMKDMARHHAITRVFDVPFDIVKAGKLVVQYEVRLHNAHVCGGAYLKLLEHSKHLDAASVDNSTPYVVMFGPDKCDVNDVVHFIFNHKSPVTGRVQEKHLLKTPRMKSDTLTHLYTLTVDSDNNFELYIDTKLEAQGSLLEDFVPAVNPPKEIDDLLDKMPSDWVTEKKIPDPTATKPDDWDEDAPRRIPDSNEVKPSGWLDDEPKLIPDPKAVAPDDWDESMDGAWEAPKIPNPKCKAVGCGRWKPKKIKNPAYKGKWKPPMIPNPTYKGEWKPRKIPNPDYFEDLHPYKFKPIGAIAFELWTMHSDVEFDNIYVGHDLEDAFAFAEATWRVKHEANKALYTSGNTKGLAQRFLDVSERHPVVMIIVVFVIVIILLIVFSQVCAVTPPPPPKTDELEREIAALFPKNPPAGDGEQRPEQEKEQGQEQGQDQEQEEEEQEQEQPRASSGTGLRRRKKSRKVADEDDDNDGDGDGDGDDE